MDMEESARQLRDAAARAREAREAAEAGAGAGQQPDADWSVVEGWLADATDGGGGTPDVVPRVRMRQLVEEHRRDGIGPTAVAETLQAEGHRTVVQTVNTWMRADAEAGILAQPGGRGQPYIPGPRFTLDR